MLDLSTASRSQVLKLQLSYEDLNLLYRCLASMLSYSTVEKIPQKIREQMKQTATDMEILLKTMREEGNIE